MKPTKNKVPKHIGIIIDGNRRFSKKLMLKPWMGHEFGARKVEKVFDWCKEYGIKELTLYAFSIENFDRPKKEFNYLMNLFIKEFSKFKDDPRIKEVKVNFIGRIWMFKKDIQELMHEIINKTKNNKGFILNFAMAYGGRAEVLDAVKKLAKDIKNNKININKINENVFAKNLYMESEPDLIIRTSGEQRTSGFLLWQGAYAEYHFCKKYWPEFSKKDFAKAIISYTNRERRFGR